MSGHTDGDDALAIFFVKEASSRCWEVIRPANINVSMIAGAWYIEAIATPAKSGAALYRYSSR